MGEVFLEYGQWQSKLPPSLRPLVPMVLPTSEEEETEVAVWGSLEALGESEAHEDVATAR